MCCYLKTVNGRFSEACNAVVSPHPASGMKFRAVPGRNTKSGIFAAGLLLGVCGVFLMSYEYVRWLGIMLPFAGVIMYSRFISGPVSEKHGFFLGIAYSIPLLIQFIFAVPSMTADMKRVAEMAVSDPEQYLEWRLNRMKDLSENEDRKKHSALSRDLELLRRGSDTENRSMVYERVRKLGKQAMSDIPLSIVYSGILLVFPMILLGTGGGWVSRILRLRPRDR